MIGIINKSKRTYKFSDNGKIIILGENSTYNVSEELFNRIRKLDGIEKVKVAEVVVKVEEKPEQETIAGDGSAPNTDSPDVSLEDLKAEAEVLGYKVPPNIKAETLAKKIDELRAKKADKDSENNQ
jgi:Tfp pilus assembly protein PilZ